LAPSRRRRALPVSRVTARARLRIPGPAIAMARLGTLPGSLGAAPPSCCFSGPAADSVSRRACAVLSLCGPGGSRSVRRRVPGPAASASRPGIPPSGSTEAALVLNRLLKFSLLVGPKGRGFTPRPIHEGLRPCAHGRDRSDWSKRFPFRFSRFRAPWFLGGGASVAPPERSGLLSAPRPGWASGWRGTCRATLVLGAPLEVFCLGSCVSSPSGRRLRSRPSRSGAPPGISCFGPRVSRAAVDLGRAAPELALLGVLVGDGSSSICQQTPVAPTSWTSACQARRLVTPQGSPPHADVNLETSVPSQIIPITPVFVYIFGLPPWRPSARLGALRSRRPAHSCCRGASPSCREGSRRATRPVEVPPPDELLPERRTWGPRRVVPCPPRRPASPGAWFRARRGVTKSNGPKHAEFRPNSGLRNLQPGLLAHVYWTRFGSSPSLRGCRLQSLRFRAADEIAPKP